MADRAMSRRKLLQRLRKFGIHEDTRKSTSHRALVAEVAPGKQVSYTLPFHGNNETINPSVIKAIRRRFRLMPTEDVSDRQFYGN